MNWTCPECGYAMDAFDVECPRCHGKGLGKPDSDAASPSTPAITPPAPTIPGTTVMGGAGPGGVPPIIKFVDPPHRHPLPYILSCLAYGGGYFLPWWQVAMFEKLKVSGQMDVQLSAVIGAALAAILMICEVVQGDKAAPFFVRLRTVISSCCLAFAAGKLLYLLFISNIVQVSFGVPIMVIAAIVMACLDFNQLSEDIKGLHFGISGAVLATALVWASYTGYEARKVTSVLAGFKALGDNIRAASEAKTKVDADVKLNAIVQAPSLQPANDMWAPQTPEPGKVFLICNVTVTFKSGGDSLQVTGKDIEMIASNKNVYNAQNFLDGFQNVNHLHATLLPGGSTTGDVIFEVDAGARPEKVYFGD